MKRLMKLQLGYGEKILRLSVETEVLSVTVDAEANVVVLWVLAPHIPTLLPACYRRFMVYRDEDAVQDIPDFQPFFIGTAVNLDDRTVWHVFEYGPLDDGKSVETTKVRRIQALVSTRDANGTPTLVPVLYDTTAEDIESGDHYEAISRCLTSRGHTVGIVIDEDDFRDLTDPLRSLILGMDWSTACLLKEEPQ